MERGIRSAVRRWMLAVVLYTTVAAGACGAELAPRTSVAAVSFNAGLAEGLVDLTEERLGPLSEAVAGKSADVVCLQEVWPARADGAFDSSRARAIVAAAETQFPHHFVPNLPNPDVSTGCSLQALQSILNCFQANCADVEDPVDCALERCRGVLMNTDRECRRCIGSTFDLSVQQIAATCRDGEGAFFAYGGQPGLLILSRHPIVESEVHILPSGAVQHAVARVLLDVPNVGRLDAYCTHLTAESLFDVFPPEGSSSFESFQATQIEALLDWVDDTAPDDRLLLLGDLNSGPAKGGLAGEFPANYSRFPEDGWSVPYVERQADPPCTFCEANTLVGASPDNVIDHVMFRTSSPTAIRVRRVERVFDRTRQIGAAGEVVETHLSDHFGVRILLRLRR